MGLLPSPLPPASMARSVLKLHPISAHPVLCLTASLPCEMRGQLGTVQALGVAWSMGEGAGNKHCPHSAFRKQCAAPQSIKLLSFLQGLV